MWASAASKLAGLSIAPKSTSTAATTTPPAPTAAVAPVTSAAVATVATVSTAEAASTTATSATAAVKAPQQQNPPRRSKPAVKQTASVVRHVILDSGAFIASHLSNLAQYGSQPGDDAAQYYSLPGVRAELRDVTSQQLYDTFPYVIQQRRISEAAMTAISTFAKLTGDFYSLSTVDLQVCALAYMIEMETHGSSNIRTEPKDAIYKKNGKARSHANSSNKPAAAAATAATEATEATEATSAATVAHQATSAAPTTAATEAPAAVAATATTATSETSTRVTAETVATVETAAIAASKLATTTTEAKPVATAATTKAAPVVAEAVATKAAIVTKAASNVSSKTAAVVTVSAITDAADSDDDEDAGEWITAANIHTQAQKHSVKPKNNNNSNNNSNSLPQTVATITTDFTLQNLMLQLGLRLINVHGLGVTSLRHFILRCYTCRHVTRDMTLEFCAACGNHTLIRQSAVVDGNSGELLYHDFTRPISTRGSKYSVPKMRGGRVSSDLILCEDMMPSFRLLQKHKKGGAGAVGDDLFSQVSEYGTMLDNPKHIVVPQYAYGKQNPNAARRSLRKAHNT